MLLWGSSGFTGPLPSPGNTRYYLTTRSHGDVLPGPVRGAWNATLTGDRLHGRTEWAFLLSTDKAGGGGQSAWEVGETNGTPLWDVMIMRWATNPLAAQTIDGLVQLCARVSRSAAGSSAVYRVHIYIAEGLTSTVRHVLLDNHLDAGAWSAVDTHRSFATPITLAPGAAVEGDRVVVEIGVSFVSNDPGDAFDTSAQMFLGTQNLFTAAVLDDAVAGATTAGAGWIDFSHVFEELPVADPPVNDACADAIAIDALPFTDGPRDTTAAVEADAAVYYRFVAARSGRHFVSSFGSNYQAVIGVYRGTDCGSLVSVTQIDFGEIWVGRGQAMTSFLAEAGETYVLKIRNYGGPLGASLGGSLSVQVFEQSLTQTGDLIVDCQHLAVFRAGRAVNIAGQFYSLTPTGSAVDYTGRAITDQNSDDPHTGPRLYVTLFGSSPAVEVVDALDLNVGQPIGDMNYIFEGVDGGENLASLVFDLEGNVLTGFFGDNYSVLGSAPTDPATAYVRRFDGVTALEEPGPPTAATAFPVALENSGSDYIDVTSNGTELFYTSGGRLIKRFNLSTNSQMADFATLPVQGAIPRPGARGLRILPPGDGSGGVLVAYGDRVLLLNGDGAVIREYLPAETEYAQDLDKVEFTPDASEFWVSDQLSTNLWRFNLATGEQLERIVTNLPTGQLSGFSVYHGYRAGLGTTGNHVCECCVATKINVINQALLKIGVSKTIASLTEQSREAYTGLLQFTPALRELLRIFPWAFATKYADSTVNTTAGDGMELLADTLDDVMQLVGNNAGGSVQGDWLYAYRYPSDCLKARRIVPSTGRAFNRHPIPFRVGRTWNQGDDSDTLLILTNEPDAVLEYTALVECAENFADALFEDALSWRLAAKFAPSLAKDDKLVARCLTMFEHSLERASVVNAREHQPEEPGDSEWIEGRNG